jgi:hypothetical protein
MVHLCCYYFFALIYRVYYQGPGLRGTQQKLVRGDTKREVNITGLMPNSTYKFIVRVFNDVGAGPYSSFIHIPTLPLRE